MHCTSFSLFFHLPCYTSLFLRAFYEPSKCQISRAQFQNIQNILSPILSPSDRKKKEMKEVFQKCLIWIFKPKIEMEKLIFATKIQPILNINRWLKMFKRKKKSFKTLCCLSLSCHIISFLTFRMFSLYERFDDTDAVSFHSSSHIHHWGV